MIKTMYALLVIDFLNFDYLIRNEPQKSTPIL